MVIKKKNKKGWIKILEAFISIILLIGLLAVIIQAQDRGNEKDVFFAKVERIMENVRFNETLRSEVINQENLPIYSTESGFSSLLKEYLENEGSKLMNCSMAICSTTDVCLLQEEVEGEIFSKESLFMSTDSVYSPRKLKVFCVKE